MIVPLKKSGDQHWESATSLGLMAIALEVKTITKTVSDAYNENIIPMYSRILRL